MKLTYEQAILALRDIPMIGHQHFNGADWLECPGCHETADIKGHASNEPFHAAIELKHQIDCPIFRAYTVVLDGEGG